MPEFSNCILPVELPLDAASLDISAMLPDTHLLSQIFPIGDPAIEVFASENTDLKLRHSASFTPPCRYAKRVRNITVHPMSHTLMM
jgi:hypothetical protein